MGQGHAKLGLGHSYSYGYRLASGTWTKAKAEQSYRLASGTWGKAKAGRLVSETCMGQGQSWGTVTVIG